MTGEHESPRSDRPTGPNGRKINACAGRLRRRILRLFSLSSPLSPVGIARLLEEPVSNIGYHLRVLGELGTVELVNERQVRGAIEHFYASLVLDDHLVQTMLEATREEDEAV